MADIKQAATWIKEGKAVRRKIWLGHVLMDYPRLTPPLQHEYPLGVDDLLADDWCIASRVYGEKAWRR